MEAIDVIDEEAAAAVRDAAADADADVGVGRRLVAAHRVVGAATLAMFDLVWELERSEGYLPLYANVASWLRWHLGLKGQTARLYVRIARRLGELPLLREALGAGNISLDQLQVLLRVATVDNQEELLELVGGCPDIDDLGAWVADRQAADQDDKNDSADSAEADPGAEEPRLSTWWRGECLHVRGVVPGADGVMVEQAFMRLGSHAPKDEETGLYREGEARMGEALVQMASEALAGEGDHDRATVVVHIPAVDLVAGEGTGWDAASRIFSAAALERLVCDARLQPALHDSGGVTVGVGRTTRTVEPWLRRLVEGRDQGCRFPGCERTRWLHCHHIIAWSELGPTNLDNLVSLCGFHHRLIHRDGWTIAGNPNGPLQFYNKWGRPHSPVPDRFPSNWAATSDRFIDESAARRLAHLTNTAAPP